MQSHPQKSFLCRKLFWLFALFVFGAGGSAAARLPVFFYEADAAGRTPLFVLRHAGMAVGIEAGRLFFGSGEQRLTQEFLGVGHGARLAGAARLEGVINNFSGADPARWRTGAPAYRALECPEIYPGIDLAYRTGPSGLKSEFIIRPGADPDRIRWRYAGPVRPYVDAEGGLVVEAGRIRLREQPPYIYQEASGSRKQVAGGFTVFEDGTVGFRVGEYDRNLPLVIDPVLSFSTYLGGAGLETARALAVDGAGNVYVGGYTDSANFPTASPYQAAGGGGVDVFVCKLKPEGSGLFFCTYLGGGSDDRLFALALDGSGNIVIGGWTYSADFPLTGGAWQRTLSGGRDAFVAKLNPAGSSLIFSTFLGGAGNDAAYAVAADGSGKVYVAGDTYSTNFPVLAGYRSSNAGRQDAFVAKLNGSSSALVWSTYLGGSGDDSAAALALDASGAVWVAGATGSTNFPTASPLKSSLGGAQDAFLARLSSDGRSLLAGTYLGGSGGKTGAPEAATALALDAGGSVYVAGITSSKDFPVVNAFQSKHGGGILDGFLVKLNSAGTSYIFSTYFGGSSDDYIYGLAVNSSRAPAVAGYTSSANLPVKKAVQSAKSGGYDGLLARFSPGGQSLEMCSYLGGSDSEAFYGLAADRRGDLWLAGQSLSLDFPVKQAYQSSNAGGYSAVVARLADNVPAAGFRASDNSVRLFSYADYKQRNAGGYIASDVAVAQNGAGDTYVAVRTSANQIWLNLFRNDLQSWNGWAYGGAPLVGNPAVVAAADGGAYVIARDSSQAYWINRYHPSTGFIGGWRALGGAFNSDPAAAVADDGTVYIAGIDGAGVVWSGRYSASAGFQGWASGGKPGGVAAAGKPAITIGSDQAAYVGARTTDNRLWAARVFSSNWGGWTQGASNLRTDPALAAGEGVIYFLLNTSTAPLAVRALETGAAGIWQAPVSIGGYLQDASLAAVYGRFFVVGRDWGGAVWWYESGGNLWTYYGFAGTVASPLGQAPCQQ